MRQPEIRTVNVIQYLQPLREGGSLPAIVKADDDFLYVLKFRGAGQGKKALVAELIGGELARAMGLQVPELVFMHLDDSFSKTEPDEEIQDLLRFSVGLNLGVHFLSGALMFDPAVDAVDPLIASKVVLLDSIINNIDRTAKNTNLLSWRRELWLIDHGAGLYFHHNWKAWRDHLGRTFPMIKDHVLLDKAHQLATAATHIRETITREVIELIIGLIPDDWLEQEGDPLDPEEKKAAYCEFLTAKLDRLDLLVKEAEDAR